MTLVEKEVHMYNGERANIYNYKEINEKFNIFSEFRDSQHTHTICYYTLHQTVLVAGYLMLRIACSIHYLVSNVFSICGTGCDKCKSTILL